MTIEGLGKKFQEARLARSLTLDEAARMTKIRPSRLAEIEADDFSQFPSLAYAKGFLQIYGKFLDVDVTPYLEAFETSEHVTVDGYSYLQENPAPAPVRAPVVRRRPSRPSSPSPASGDRPSLMPLIIGIVVIVVGFWLGKLLVNLRRLSPPSSKTTAATTASPAPSASALPYSAVVPAPTTQFSTESKVASNATAPPATAAPAATAAAQAPPAASIAPSQPATPPVVAAVPKPPAPAPSAAPSEPEVRRAEPVRPEDLAKATEAAGPNRVVIRPLKKTYMKVVIDNEAVTPAFERWVSPSDGTLEFRGAHVAIRVLDRDAVQIKKNGKALEDADSDITIE